MEIFQIPQLRQPIMIVAFSGWSDAGEAATSALTHLMENLSHGSLSSEAVLIAEYEPEDFYDFQVNRPMISVDDSLVRSVNWPSTQIYGLSTPEFENDFVLVLGVEPSMKWKTFTTLLLDLADDLEVELVVTLGAMLADAPHTRPISVSGSGGHPDIAARLGVEISKYEGPTGILGIIGDGCVRRGIDCVSLWAGLPHYASNSPSPKATLALVNAVEDFLEISISLADLEHQAKEWENEVSEMAEEDSEVSEYVKALEESKDATEFKDVSGDEIARELERFLRRQNEN
jgi:predicted ATP-grasp superfamily ATP-dependent carboligase